MRVGKSEFFEKCEFLSKMWMFAPVWYILTYTCVKLSFPENSFCGSQITVVVNLIWRDQPSGQVSHFFCGLSWNFTFKTAGYTEVKCGLCSNAAIIEKIRCINSFTPRRAKKWWHTANKNRIEWPPRQHSCQCVSTLIAQFDPYHFFFSFVEQYYKAV